MGTEATVFIRFVCICLLLYFLLLFCCFCIHRSNLRSIMQEMFHVWVVTLDYCAQLEISFLLMFFPIVLIVHNIWYPKSILAFLFVGLFRCRTSCWLICFGITFTSSTTINSTVSEGGLRRSQIVLDKQFTTSTSYRSIST